MNLLYVTWNFNPSVIPGYDIPRWYGLMWAFGFYLGYLLLTKIYNKEHVPANWMDKTFLYVLLGGVLGARLGHCIFYQPHYYFVEHPEEIIMIWKGGLASHGGTFGIFVAVYLLSKRVTHKSMLWVLDRLVIPTAVAGALIRLGNLFNHEIVGIETKSALGFKFLRNDIGESQAVNLTGINDVNDAYTAIASDPAFADILAQVPIRYPAQLFESISCVFIFGLIFWLYWKTNAGTIKGFIFGTFLVTTFGTRFLIEFIKENQEGLDQTLDAINMGQILSIPLVLLGLYMVFRNFKQLKRGYVDQTEGRPVPLKENK